MTSLTHPVTLCRGDRLTIASVKIDILATRTLQLDTLEDVRTAQANAGLVRYEAPPAGRPATPLHDASLRGDVLATNQLAVRRERDALWRWARRLTRAQWIAAGVESYGLSREDV